jgi:DnaJ-class molecular chaperone
MALKRPVPVTFCTECGNAGYNPTLTKLRCGKTVNGERCKGTNSNASDESDWKECDACNGIGAERNAACARCRGVGWVPSRSVN